MSVAMKTHDLTLGFLTLGAQAAPMEVLDAAAAAGFGAAGLRVSGRHPGDAWPSVDPRSQDLERLREEAGARGVRISSISGYYLSPATRPEHLLCNVEAARRTGAPLIMQGCFEPDLARVARLLPGYAQAAAAAGVRIALEFMPMSALRFCSFGSSRGSYSRESSRGSQSSATHGEPSIDATAACVIEIGQA